MSRRQTMLLIGLALLVALGVWVAARNPEPPLLPDDEYHRNAYDVSECLYCHGKEGDAPRDRNHPIGDECSRCHGRR